ncbi:MAG: pyridoxal phosphate-dependent aminotransferase family protein [Maribacter sp.]|nr:pyridoxal phosphate-dependent aminotransferase family protein [Maribacter sp.]
MIHYIHDYPGREINIKGEKYLYFGGTSYLGLQTDEEFQNVFIKNIKKYGTNYGASRNSNVRLKVFDKAETLLARIVGCEAAVTLSSGYLAGQFIAQNFNQPEYKLYYAPYTHSALYANYNKPAETFDDLNRAIRTQLATFETIVPVVFLDSIDFEGCNFPEFNRLKELPLDQIILIADDSHGIGIIGENGEGVFRTLQKFNTKELIVCCSLGKSYGIQAGAVMGSAKRIEQLRKTAFFGGASPAAPASIGTFLDSHSIYDVKREQLLANIAYFENRVQNMSYFKSMEGHPAYTFQDKKLSEYLENNGFVLTNFNYPEESTALMSRIVISSHHLEHDIKLITKAINTYYLG